MAAASPTPHRAEQRPRQQPIQSPVTRLAHPIEKRRDTACDTIRPSSPRARVADAKANLAAGKVSQKQFDADTSPQVQAKNDEKFLEKCKAQKLNSYQVRVYEVCMREETDCDPLLQCLLHVKDAAAGGAK